MSDNLSTPSMHPEQAVQWWAWIARVLRAEWKRREWHEGMYPQVAEEIRQSRRNMLEVAQSCEFNAAVVGRAPIAESLPAREPRPADLSEWFTLARVKPTKSAAGDWLLTEVELQKLLDSLRD